MREATAPSTTGFEEEALPHLDAVYRFALRLSGSPDHAEDLVDAFGVPSEILRTDLF